jgi:hypothetical protein
MIRILVSTYCVHLPRSSVYKFYNVVIVFRENYFVLDYIQQIYINLILMVMEADTTVYVSHFQYNTVITRNV